jgi:predicted RNA binding protein YcfA (HicA-like mRNA interferase family)
MPEQSHYRTLNIIPTASPDEIQRAYRNLARRYHPDRNPAPAASTLMALINEAYEILSEPGKRAAYDRKHDKKQDERIDGPVITAAKSILLKQGWTVARDGGSDLVLKHGSRQVYVAFAPLLTRDLLRQCVQRSTGVCVVLAVRVDSDLPRCPGTVVVIDLLRSRIHAGEFPDSTYRDLFKNFL